MPPAFPTEVECAGNVKQTNASFTFQQLIKLFKPKTLPSHSFHKNVFFQQFHVLSVVFEERKSWENLLFWSKDDQYCLFNLTPISEVLKFETAVLESLSHFWQVLEYFIFYLKKFLKYCINFRFYIAVKIWNSNFQLLF